MLGMSIAASPAGAAPVTKGTFETGNLAGWTVTNTGLGNWFTYTGKGATGCQGANRAPTQGVRAAATGKNGVVSHILDQVVALEADASHTLSFSASTGPVGRSARPTR